MKPFDLEKALNGAKLVTRDGREAKHFKKHSSECFGYCADIMRENDCFLTNTYTKKGTFFIDKKSVFDLFLAEEEFAPKFGDKVEVSDNERDWKQRIFIGEYKGRYHAVAVSSETPFNNNCAYMCNSWDYIRPIQPKEEPKLVELTMQEIADKLSIPVKDLRIKK